MGLATSKRPTMSSMSPGSLKTDSVSSFLWGGTGTFLKLLIQAGSQIVLARILGPEQYGLFAIGVIVFSFSNLLSDIGLAYGLIQRKELAADHVRFIFTWQLILGTLVAASVALLAAPLADFFGEPRARDIILALAPLCFVQAMTAVSFNLLKRSMDFRSISLAGLLAHFLGFVCVGIPLAMSGFQVWALIAAWAVQVCLNLAFLYRCSRHELRPLLKHADSAEMTRFGLAVLATNLTNWFIGNVDRVVAARFLPTVALGLYTTPYNLMNTPAATLIGVIQPVMYSACARVQGENARIRSAYLALLGAITLFAMPVFIASSAVATTLVLALYGSAWNGAATVLQPIALAMPLYLIWAIATPVLWTSGRIGSEFRMQVAISLVWLIGSVLAAQHSVGALAWTVLGMFALRALAFTLAAAQAMKVSVREFVRVAIPGAVLSIVIGGCALVVDTALTGVLEAPAARLASVVLTCGLVGLAALRQLHPLIDPQLTLLIGNVLQKLPVRMSATVSGLVFKGKRA